MLRRLSTGLIIASLLVLFEGGGAPPWPAPFAAATHPTTLPSGAYFGGYFGEKTGFVISHGQDEINTETVECGAPGCSTPLPGNTPFPNTLGRRLAFTLEFYFPASLTAAAMSADQVIQGDLLYHRMPALTFGVGDTMQSYISGAHDDQLTASANALEALHVPILLRPFHEFNYCMPVSAGGGVTLSGSIYSGCSNGDYGGACPQGDTLAQCQTLFQQWWHHVYTVMSAIDPNIIWVWNPALGPGHLFTYPQLLGFLPANLAEVDYTGIDTYDRNAGNGFDGLIGTPYSNLAPIGKPIMILETAETAYSGGNPVPTPGPNPTANPGGCTIVTGLNTQENYIANAHRELPTNYPLLRAFSYFASWPVYPHCSSEWILPPPPSPAFTALQSLGLDTYFAPMGY